MFPIVKVLCLSYYKNSYLDSALPSWSLCCYLLSTVLLYRTAWVSIITSFSFSIQLALLYSGFRFCLNSSDVEQIKIRWPLFILYFTWPPHYFGHNWLYSWNTARTSMETFLTSFPRSFFPHYLSFFTFSFSFYFLTLVFLMALFSIFISSHRISSSLESSTISTPYSYDSQVSIPLWPQQFQVPSAC